jgi:hypothetical protein
MFVPALALRKVLSDHEGQVGRSGYDNSHTTIIDDPIQAAHPLGVTYGSDD